MVENIEEKNLFNHAAYEFFPNAGYLYQYKPTKNTEITSEDFHIHQSAQMCGPLRTMCLLGKSTGIFCSYH